MVKISEEITQLRDFLVPYKKKSKLVKNWLHIFEVEDGTEVFDRRQAIRFCIWGGIKKLSLSDRTQNFVTRTSYHLPRLFLFSESHSTKEVRDLLNLAIQKAKEYENGSI